MATNLLCACSHASAKKGKKIILTDISLDARKGQGIALISKDGSAACVLRLIAGLLTPFRGEISYPALSRKDRSDFPKKLQYVPDHIVQYYNLTAAEFLIGMSKKRSAWMEEANRLISLFEIPASRQLLNMTYEENRLVSIIQAMMADPALLLLDRPWHMLEPPARRILAKELSELQDDGAGLILSSESYSDVRLPCSRYMFLQGGKIIADYARQELPVPAKVITLQGGSPPPMHAGETELLDQKGASLRFLYHSRNMQKLSYLIYKTKCQDFSVEELSMEEALFEDYDGWML